MAKRNYTKRNPLYWENRARAMKKEPTAPTLRQVMAVSGAEFEPEFAGEALYVNESRASYSRTRTDESERSGTSTKGLGRFKNLDLYSNIDRYALPFEYSNGVASARDSIMLCQKAYFYIAIVRNTIDLMSEFANSEAFLEGGTDASRNFVQKWLDTIKFENLKKQYFREYYRSGNVFLYRIYGDFTPEEIRSMRKIYSSRASQLIEETESPFEVGKLPLRYLMLNPADIANYDYLTSQNVYRKVLTSFEAQRLVNPSTEEEKRLSKSLSQEEMSKLGKLQGKADIHIPLEPSRLIYSFYKKQDYEPFAVPFCFSVLEDVNAKLEMKKADQAVLRSIENIILLITAGNEPEKGGINPKHLEALKTLFQNEQVGRVLIADYTTKAGFIIPDIKKIVGREKYEVINQDIKEGLQNVLFEDAKYSNNEIKTKIFLDRLSEARESFVTDFMQEEIKKVCRFVGFRECPTLKFKEVDLSSQEAMHKVMVRLIELGIIHPEAGVTALKNREYPRVEDMPKDQERLVKEREDGKYNPLVGGQPMFEGAGTGTPTGGIPKPSGRPTSSSATVNKDRVVEATQKISGFESWAKEEMKKSKSLDALSDDQTKIVEDICKAIVLSTENQDWEDKFTSFASGSIVETDLEIKPEILDIMSEFETDELGAAIIFHAKS